MNIWLISSHVHCSCQNWLSRSLLFEGGREVKRDVSTLPYFSLIIEKIVSLLHIYEIEKHKLKMVEPTMLAICCLAGNSQAIRYWGRGQIKDHWFWQNKSWQIKLLLCVSWNYTCFCWSKLEKGSTPPLAPLSRPPWCAAWFFWQCC